jgi:type II secretory pathway component PulK
MNVLGFISALLLVLALFIGSICQDLFSFAKRESSYQSYSEAARSAQNQYEIAYYKSFKTLKKKEAPAIQKTTEKKEKPKQVKWENMPECARLNIAQLLTEKSQDIFRLELFRKLIKSLYGNTLLAQQKNTITALSLPDQILSAAKKTAPFLVQAELKDPTFQFLFYQMLKGSNQHAESYYPSLLEYIKVDDSNEKICLSCADEKMLAALFNEKIAKRLTEKKEHSLERLSITKTELEEILASESFATPNDEFWGMISFSHPKKKKNEITLSGKGREMTLKKKAFLR